MGGVGAAQQVEALEAKPTFIIATPGRLIELLEQRAVSFGTVKAVVVDEADRMIDMGFLPQLETVLAAVPSRRQSLLFSATLGQSVRDFGKRALRNPVRAEVVRSGTPAEGAEQRILVVEPEEKYAVLLALLAQDQLPTLIFSSTRERTEKVQRTLKREGIKSAVIHSERTQNQRKQALQGFRDGKYRCLVATEVAARGLDIEDVGHVINFDLPHAPEDYVHRIGRTARAGARGKASSFVTHEDARFVARIEKVMHRDLTKMPVPRRDPVFLAEMERFADVKELSDARHAKRMEALVAPAPAGRDGRGGSGRGKGAGPGKKPAGRSPERPAGRKPEAARASGPKFGAAAGSTRTAGATGKPGRKFGATGKPNRKAGRVSGTERASTTSGAPAGRTDRRPAAGPARRGSPGMASGRPAGRGKPTRRR
jgi:ATP-dependent RNA helicase RhlE